jgi:hypothetical protein
MGVKMSTNISYAYLEGCFLGSDNYVESVAYVDLALRGACRETIPALA